MKTFSICLYEEGIACARAQMAIISFGPNEMIECVYLQPVKATEAGCVLG